MRTVKYLLTLACLCTFSSLVAAAHELDGAWTFDVALDAGTGMATLTLTVAEDNTISGTYSGIVGEVPVTGKVEGDQVEISFTSDQAGTVVYKGTLAAGELSGTAEYGALGSGTFKAKKAEA